MKTFYLIRIAVACCCAAVMNSATTRADDLFSQLDEDIPLVVRVCDIKKVVQTAEEMWKQFLDDPLCQGIEKELAKSVNRFEEIERNESLWLDAPRKVEDVLHLLKSSKEVLILLNSKEKTSYIIVLVQLDHELVSELTDRLGALKTLFESLSSNSDKPKSGFFEFRKTDDWVLVAIGDTTGFADWAIPVGERKLVDTRRFKAAESILKSRTLGKSNVEIFANPKYLKKMFPESEVVWKGSKVDEMPMIAASLSFDPNAGDKPSILIRGAATFTEPRVGIGNLLQAYDPVRPIEVDSIPFYEFHVTNFNNQRHFDAQSKIYADSTGKEKYWENLLAAQYKESKIDYREDVLNNSRERYTFWTKRTDSKSHVYHPVLLISPVNRPDAVQRYLDRAVANANTFRGSQKKPPPGRQKLHRVPHELGVMYQEDNDFPYADCYFYNDHFFIVASGARKDAEAVIEEFDGKFPKAKYFLNKEIDGFLQYSGAYEPIQIDIYSPTSWLRFMDDPIRNRLRAKGLFKDKITAAPEFKVESIEDLRALFELNLLAAYYNRFGTQVRVYTQNDSTVFLDIGVFESPNKIFGDRHDWRIKDPVEEYRQRLEEYLRDYLELTRKRRPEK